MKYLSYGYHDINDKDIAAVQRILKGLWITQGPMIAEFEKKLCEYTGARYAVTVSSGTAALHIACLALDIGLGDEAITSPITFVASANCVLYCGGKVKFADIEPDTANIDANKLEQYITKKTKLIIPVHYAGHPCDMHKIHTVAKKYKIRIIEDAAHALGAVYIDDRLKKEIMVGSCVHSDMTTLSFHPVKHITTGEGGAVLTNDKKLYEKLLILRNHGITKKNFVNKPHGDWYYEMQQLGLNYRITDIQCALGLSQMKKIKRFVARRREIANIYYRAFKDNPFFYLPTEKKDVTSSYHLYPIRFKSNFISVRKKIFAQLRKKGIGIQVHYNPVYRQPYYRKLGYKQNQCPCAEDFYKREISIPMFPALKKNDIAYVIKTILNVCKSFA